MDPLIIGAGIGAFGNIASGFFGRSDPGNDALEAYVHRREYDRKWASKDAAGQGRALKAFANSAGVHPLAAMGAQTSMAGVSPVGSHDTGSGTGDLIRGIASGVAAIMEEYGVSRSEAENIQREKARVGMELGAAQLRETEARIANQSAAAANEMAQARVMIQEARAKSYENMVQRTPGWAYQVEQGDWRYRPYPETGVFGLPASGGEMIAMDPNAVPIQLLEDTLGEFVSLPESGARFGNAAVENLDRTFKERTKFLRDLY